MAVRDQAPYAAVDAHYPAGGGARAAVVTAWEPRFARIVEERVCWLAAVAPYQPGQFYARELPALRTVLDELGHPVSLVIIDGYVDLDPHGRPGLGAHLHAHLNVPVIGVAKTAFRTASHAIAVRRGTAQRPLYVNLSRHTRRTRRHHRGSNGRTVPTTRRPTPRRCPRPVEPRIANHHLRQRTSSGTRMSAAIRSSHRTRTIAV